MTGWGAGKLRSTPRKNSVGSKDKTSKRLGQLDLCRNTGRCLAAVRKSEKWLYSQK